MKTSRTSSVLKALALTAPAFMAPLCWADITGPYTPDANTAYLFHFDEAAGSTMAANSVPNGFNAVAYSTPGGNNANATANTTILGASGYSGFGNAANIATANQGLGIDANKDGSFQLNSGTVAGDIQADHSSIFGVNNAFTLEALISLPALLGPTVNREIICSDSAAGTRGFQFRVSGSNLELNWVGAGTTGWTMAIPTTGPEAFVANEWFHVALSYDGVKNSVYWTRLDPSRTQATLLNESTAEAPIPTSGMLLDLGNEGRSAGSSLGSAEGLQGKIDEVRISKVALGPDQFVFTVPEPNSMALATLFGLSLVVLRRRK